MFYWFCVVLTFGVFFFCLLVCFEKRKRKRENMKLGIKEVGRTQDEWGEGKHVQNILHEKILIKNGKNRGLHTASRPGKVEDT